MNHNHFKVKPIKSGKAQISNSVYEKTLVSLVETDYDRFEKALKSLLEAEALPIGMDIADIDELLFGGSEAFFFLNENPKELLKTVQGLNDLRDSIVGGLGWTVNRSFDELSTYGDWLAELFPNTSLLFQAVSAKDEKPEFCLLLIKK